MNNERLPNVINHEGILSPEIKNPKYSLVILDFHGTMTDHQLRAIKAYHHAGHEALGIHLGKEFYQHALTRPSIQLGKPTTNREFVQSEFNHHGEEKVNNYWETFQKYMDKTYIPIPGIIQVANNLLEMGTNITLLTNGSDREVIKTTLNSWGLESLADTLVSSHITGVKKPNVRALEHILEDYRKKGMNFTPDNTLSVGDYIDDIRTSDALSIDSVLMVRGNGWEKFKIREPKPTYIITDPKDLIHIVKGDFKQELGGTFELKPMLWPNETWGPKE